MKLSRKLQALYHERGPGGDVAKPRYHLFQIVSFVKTVAKRCEVETEKPLIDGLEDIMEFVLDVTNNCIDPLKLK